MKAYVRMIERLSEYMNVIAGIALSFMMMLTVIDVILRRFGKAIPGTYELVAFTGVVVIGFALAYSTWVKAHVVVDFALEAFSGKTKRAINVMTRIIGIAFFAVLGIYLIQDGFSLISTGELSPTLQFPFYPVAFGLAVCSFIQCLVLFADSYRAWEAHYE